jgi:hypothetical protein
VAVMRLIRLESLELELLLPDHLKETIHVRFLFRLKLLVKLAQTWSTMVIGIGHEGRS